MELPQLGKQCALGDCQQLDFLPFECNHCHRIFCKQHFSPDNHECIPVNPLPQRNCDIQHYYCSKSDCQAASPVEMACPFCRLHFCLQHRHHGCIDKDETSYNQELEQWLAPQRQFEKAKQEVDQQVEEGLSRARKKAASMNTANKVQLMRLKSKATGSKAIPSEDRVYFLVLPPLSTKSMGKAVFVSRQWSVGRVIDAVADICGVSNRNNCLQAPKLRLFSQADGRIVCSSLEKKLDDLLTTEVLYNGEKLILEYVSPQSDQEIQCLENVNLYVSG
ncbi:AN1-type zinc finger protein 1 [Anabrus simplex]|uniref:AN1-type zinc finger protein 1 n=1 Tax=Anabrus simplex TaxID=316456 RepID=UPI0034DD63FE